MPLITTMRLTRNARHLVRDAQALHRTLLYDTTGRILWALPEPNFLVIQHHEPVNWHTRLPGIINHSHTVQLQHPAENSPIKWVVIGNPVRRHNHKAAPLPPEAHNQWIANKLEQALSLHEIHSETLTPAIGRKTNRTITHHRVLFHGTGTVANQDNLQNLQHTGVGRAKAYGCGLLIVRETA